MKGVNALGLCVGLILVHDGRRIRLDEDLGDWVMRFTDVETDRDYLVTMDGSDELLNPNVLWLLTEKEAGRLEDPTATADMDGRRRGFMGLDKAACTRRDRKSAWRFRWAWAVMTQGPETKSDASYEDWIETRADLIPDENGKEEKKPKASSLRRWERKLKAAKGRRGVLVSCAGRLKGQSQLKGLEDWLVHEAALYFWSAEEGKVIDAGGHYIDLRDRLLEAGGDDVAARLEADPVRMETIRQRIRSLEGRETTAAKEGERRAKRMFDIVGDGVPVERFLERVEVDGVELKQIVRFSSGWPVNSGKMKCVNVVDGATGYWWLPPTFFGPYRAEMTAAALTAVMTPPTHFTAQELAERPERGEAWGTPDLIEPDNEKALVAPADVPALTELGPTFELPKTNHPDGKPMVEAVNRFLKGWLDSLPGTVRGPCHPKDPTRNVMREAEITAAQLRVQIILANKYWNEAGRDQFGGRSSLDMVKACRDAGVKPKRNPPGEVRRATARTQDNIVLSREGFEFDGIHYKSDAFGAVVDANFKHTGFKDRVDGTSKVRVSIRTFEDNLHPIEVFDQERQRFVPGESTEPEYTLHLSRYEHTEFKAALAAERPRRETEVNRMRLRSAKLKHAAESLPRATAKAASRLAALLESATVRHASGARAHSPDFGPALVNGLLAKTGGDLRTDVPKPVPTPGSPKAPAPPPAPEALLAAIGVEEGGPDEGPDASPTADKPANTPMVDDDFSWPGLPEGFGEDDDDEEDEL